MVKVDGAYCTERAADRRSKHLRRNCEACASSSINRASSAVDHSFGRTSPSPSSFPPSPQLPLPSSSSSHPRDCVGHSRPLFVRLDVPRPRNKNITYASLTHSLTDSLAHSPTHPLRLASGLRPRSTAAVLSRARGVARWSANRVSGVSATSICLGLLLPLLFGLPRTVTRIELMHRRN